MPISFPFSAYRDPNEEIPEVSSLGSKDGMSEIDGASGGEHYKDPNKLSFVGHYTHDPKHQSWRTTLDNQDDAVKAKYDEYMNEAVPLPDDFQKPRFKSFSSLEGKDFPVPPPPAYESHPEDDGRYYDELPGESVTSFMSPEYEARKTRSLGRPKSAMTRHIPYDSDEELDGRQRRGYGSQNQLDEYPTRRSGEELRQPHRGSREHFEPSHHRKPRMDGYSYATMPHPRSYPKPSEIYQNVSHSPSGHEGDVSSEVSSSSNGDHRTPGRYPRGPKPRYPPKPDYIPKDSPRRRNRPPSLVLPPSKYQDHSTSSDSPTSPISPAPSYHSNDEYDPRYRTLPPRIPPPVEYADERCPEPVYQNTLPRREPMIVMRRGRSHEQIDSNEVQISPYQSFV